MDRALLLEALETLDRAASAYRGTRADHVSIQSAVNTLRAALDPPPASCETPPKPATIPNEPEPPSRRRRGSRRPK